MGKGLRYERTRKSLVISGLSPTAKTRLLNCPCSRTKFTVVIGLLAGHNTLRKHFYLKELTNSPLCRRCGAEDETSAHNLCECVASDSLRHAYFGSFLLDPEDVKSLSLRLIVLQ